MIRVGFQVWGQCASWPQLAQTARDIELLAFDSLWSNDHLYSATGGSPTSPEAPDRPCLEGWMTLAGFAAVTSTIRLGVLVSGAGYRNPGLLVKQATALDHVSGGRVTLGLGAGWHEREHRAFGFGFPSLTDRITRLDEQAAVVRRLLDGEEVTFGGGFVEMERARNVPPPIQDRMLLLIGGSGERRTLRIVARYADVWNGEGDPTTYRRKDAILDEHCVTVGRNPTSIRRTVGLPPLCIRSTKAAAVDALSLTFEQNGLAAGSAREAAAASPFAGTEADVMAALDDYGAAGASEAILDWPAPFDLESLERLAAARGSRR